MSNETGTTTPDVMEETLDVDASPDPDNEGYEGLIMSADVARNPADYVKFMATYQVESYWPRLAVLLFVVVSLLRFDFDFHMSFSFIISILESLHSKYNSCQTSAQSQTRKSP